MQQTIPDDAAARSLLKIGSLAAIVGCLIFMVSNVLHPRSPDISDYRQQIKTVGTSDIWVADHLVFLLGALLMSAGLLAVGRALAEDVAAQPWVRLADAMMIVSAAVVAVLMAVDGLASKEVHQAALAAPPDQSVAYYAAAELMETIDASVFSIWICTFFGLTFGLYSVALLSGERFPHSAGWVAAVAASAAFVLGVIQGVDGLSKLVTNQLFVLAASVLNTWLLVISVVIYRRVRRDGARPLTASVGAAAPGSV